MLRAIGVIVGKSRRSGMTAKLRARSKGNGASAATMAASLGQRGIPGIAAVFVAFLAYALDRDHPLALRGVEHDHTLGRAPGDADTFDARADELTAVGHQHELIPVLDRE